MISHNRDHNQPIDSIMQFPTAYQVCGSVYVGKLTQKEIKIVVVTFITHDDFGNETLHRFALDLVDSVQIIEDIGCCVNALNP